MPQLKIGPFPWWVTTALLMPVGVPALYCAITGFFWIIQFGGRALGHIL
jgi:hypothetical protein